MNLENNKYLTIFFYQMAAWLTITIVMFLTIKIYWFPGTLISLGGYEGLALVTSIDFVLGPLISLAVLSRNKTLKHIKIDLAVLSIIRAVVLVLGVYIVSNERPIAQILSIDGIHILTPKDYKIAKTPTDGLKGVSGAYPKRIFLDMPKDKAEAIIAQETYRIMNGNSIAFNIGLYHQILATSPQELENRLATYFGEAEKTDTCIYLPFFSNHGEGQACLNMNTGEIDSLVISYEKVDLDGL